jgi:hypothetical protein
VVVAPATPTVSIFGTQPFGATVTGSANKAVTWQVNGVTGGNQQSGFISAAGLYVAPSGVPTASDGQGGTDTTTVTVTAISQASASATGSAVVTLKASPNQNAQSGAIKLGTSGGNVNDTAGGFCCSGTLGSLVTRSGTQYILSNNHVLAKSDFGVAGDKIAQPGLVDNNCAAGSTVANLSEWFKLETGPLPKVDAAIAQVVAGKVDASGNILLLGATQTNGVPDPGAPHAGTGITATLGETVAKSGRTTGLTCSSVGTLNFSVSVQYTQNCDGTGTKYTVNFANLVEVLGGTFSTHGDSGSLIVDQNSADPVALLFAGNDTGAVGNTVSDVLNSFVGAGNATPTFVGDTSQAGHKVIGCTLPTQPASARLAMSVSAPAPEVMQKAVAVRDAHAPELMAHPEVQAVGVGPSYDSPGEAAIVFFVTKGQPRTSLPLQVDGVRTRIVENEIFAPRGIVSTAESAGLEQSAPAPLPVYATSEAEIARAKVVQAAHMAEVLKLPGVQGVGITSSVDSPGEAALLIYFIRGVSHDPAPVAIDGLRTRVREGSRFRGDYGGARPKRGCSVPAPKKTQAGATSVTKP